MRKRKCEKGSHRSQGQRKKTKIRRGAKGGVEAPSLFLDTRAHVKLDVGFVLFARYTCFCVFF
jgi:hypothetical protein